ncbi:hypothetical protein BC826DRAFT_554828 [Russula brevipes]|nr:hypothetical protein BC826DRAFT_554828 [Russula brevipes]
MEVLSSLRCHEFIGESTMPLPLSLSPLWQVNLRIHSIHPSLHESPLPGCYCHIKSTALHSGNNLVHANIAKFGKEWISIVSIRYCCIVSAEVPIEGVTNSQRSVCPSFTRSAPQWGINRQDFDPISIIDPSSPIVFCHSYPVSLRSNMMFIRTIVALSLASLVLAAPSAQSEKRQARLGQGIGLVSGVVNDVNGVGDVVGNLVGDVVADVGTL